MVQPASRNGGHGNMMLEAKPQVTGSNPVEGTDICGKPMLDTKEINYVFLSKRR